MRNRQAQTIIEYAIIIGIITAAFFAMNKYLQRAMQESVKVAADELGSQATGRRETETFPGVDRYRGSSYTIETKVDNKTMALTAFKPSQASDRAEVAVLLSRAFNIGPSYSSASAFSDVQSDYWAYGEINALAQAGIVDGFSGGDYRPDEATDRGQFAIMLYRALKLEPYSGTGPVLGVADSADPELHELYQAVGALYNMGIVEGYDDDGLYHPERALRRGHAAMMITRAIGLTPYVGPNVFSDVPEQPPADWPGYCYWPAAEINALYKAGIAYGYGPPAGRQSKEISETTTYTGFFQNAWYGEKSMLDKEIKIPGEKSGTGTAGMGRVRTPIGK
jgi:Flp pilus assembly pilin Flp